MVLCMLRRGHVWALMLLGCNAAITPPILWLVANTIIARPTTVDFSYTNMAQLRYIQTWINFATYMKILGAYGYISHVAISFTFSGGEMVAHL